MRILVQRILESWVKVDGVDISRIKKGLLVLVGLTHDDNFDVADHMVSKILNMRLWEREGKTWNGSVMDIQG
jgi:D-tyrosyl-tRNA(Tyr) deacylase